jgi:tetratricopeptide (TPR) repeat protein
VEDSLGKRWLKAIEGVDAKNVRDADRLAWAAYGRGAIETARRWLGRADAANPYTLWLRAKFALRDGRIPAAAKLLSEAVPKFAPVRELETRYVGAYTTFPDAALKADLGVTRLHRGEFVDALRLFLKAARIKDAFYVADAVLTIDELKKFIEREYPQVEAPKQGEGDTEELGVSPDDWTALEEKPALALRELLARRLVRLERYAEARPILRVELAKSWMNTPRFLRRRRTPRR